MTGNSNTQLKRAMVPPELARQIDENLKRLYADQVKDAVPESLAKLLDALRRKEAQSRPEQR